jgi:hypothetical protein
MNGVMVVHRIYHVWLTNLGIAEEVRADCMVSFGAVRRQAGQV